MIVQFTQERGDYPADPLASEVALEASVSEARAASVIRASWNMVETYTGTQQWPVMAAVALVEMDQERDVRWPRRPAPLTVTIETLRDGDWQPNVHACFIPQLLAVFDLEPGRHRITQVGTLTPDPVIPIYEEAVRNLALYQLIHAPQRREFRSVQAGGDTVTREALMPLFRGSGAGALLASELRW